MTDNSEGQPTHHVLMLTDDEARVLNNRVAIGAAIILGMHDALTQDQVTITINATLKAVDRENQEASISVANRLTDMVRAMRTKSARSKDLMSDNPGGIENGENGEGMGGN